MLIVFNLIVVALVLGLGYLWMTRGFFSAFLHLLCTIAAGAFAFAFWEMLGGMLLGAAPTSGFARFLHGMSWGLGLLIPFLVALVVLRVITDKVIKANVKQAARSLPARSRSWTRRARRRSSRPAARAA